MTASTRAHKGLNPDHCFNTSSGAGSRHAGLWSGKPQPSQAATLSKLAAPLAAAPFSLFFFSNRCPCLLSCLRGEPGRPYDNIKEAAQRGSKKGGRRRLNEVVHALRGGGGRWVGVELIKLKPPGFSLTFPCGLWLP